MITDNVRLTIKIDPILKETLKSVALENHVSLSQEVCQRLQNSLTAVEHTAVANPAIVQQTDDPLTANELKPIRTLLKKAKKKK